MPSSTQNAPLWQSLQTFEGRTLEPSELAAFCERGFRAIGAKVAVGQTVRCPEDSLVVALFTRRLLSTPEELEEEELDDEDFEDEEFEPEEFEPDYSEYSPFFLEGNLFVFTPQVSAQRVPGIVLYRRKRKWRACPHTIDGHDIVKESRCFTVNCDWITVLYLIGTSEYNDALHLNEGLTRGYWDFFSEFGNRTNSFRFRMRPALFHNNRDFLAWNVALLWDEWVNESVTTAGRILQLSEKTQCNITVPTLDLLDPAVVIRSIRNLQPTFNSSMSTSQLNQEGFEIAADMVRRPIGMERVSYTGYQTVNSKDYLFFSFGGPPELSFSCRGTSDRLFLSRPASNEMVLGKLLWWWRQIPEWPELAAKIFTDNFESSSFNYELAARCIYGRHWKPFGAPWVELSNFKRGMLNTIWPTKRFGPYTFIFSGESLWEFQPGMNRVLVPVDLRVPQADVLSMVAEIHRRERLKRNLPEPGGRRKKEESSPWEVLELLDRKDLLGQKLKASEERLIKAVVGRLYEDCRRLGIKIDS